MVAPKGVKIWKSVDEGSLMMSIKARSQTRSQGQRRFRQKYTTRGRLDNTILKFYEIINNKSKIESNKGRFPLGVFFARGWKNTPNGNRPLECARASYPTYRVSGKKLTHLIH